MEFSSMSKKNAWFAAGDIVLSWLITMMVFLANFRDLSVNLNIYESLAWVWFVIGIAASGTWCMVNSYHRTKLRAVLPPLRRILIIELGFSLLFGQSLTLDIIQIAVVLAAAQLLLADITRLKHDKSNPDSILKPVVALVIAAFICCMSFWIESNLFISWSIFKEAWFIAMVAVLDVVAIVVAIFTRSTWLPGGQGMNAKKSGEKSLQSTNQVKIPALRVIAACFAVLALATLPGMFLGIIDETSHETPGILSQQWLMFIIALIAIVLLLGSLLSRGLFRHEPRTAFNRKKWFVFWSIAAVALLWFVPYVWKRIDLNNRDVPFTMNIAVHVAMLYVIPALAAWFLYCLVKTRFNRNSLVLVSGTAAAGFCFGCIGFMVSFSGIGEYIFPSIEGGIMVLGLLGVLYLDIGEREMPPETFIDAPRPPMFGGNFGMLGLVVCIGIEFNEFYLYTTSQPQVNLQYLLLYPACFIIAAMIGWLGTRSGHAVVVLVLAIAGLIGLIMTWFMPTFLSITHVIDLKDPSWHLVPMHVTPFLAGVLFSLVSDGRYRLGALTKDVGWAIFSTTLGAVLGWAGYNEMRSENAVTLAVSFVALCIVIAAMIAAWVRSTELDIAKPVHVIMQKKTARDASGN